jgi:SAM-dependent methyltransferase
MDFREIDFDHELDTGSETYNRALGQWWRNRSGDASHRYAYRKIADHMESFFSGVPERIVDYGCGSGNLLSRLYLRFPLSHLIGIDGSSLLLGMSRKRMRHLDKHWRDRVALVETELPDFSLPSGIADLLVFAFPNIVPDPDQEEFDEECLGPGDFSAAEYLSQAREPDPEEETVTDEPETVYDSLMTDRVISYNLRGLLRKGGICIRIEYANADRKELTDLVRQRLAFEEGSLDKAVNGQRAPQLFALLDSTYFRSKVIEDVYHQTGDEEDLEGGYHLTTLVAV